MWHLAVQWAIDAALAFFAAGLSLAALINCSLQRADAFAAIGTLQKPAWLAILGASVFVVLCIALPGLTGGGARMPFTLMFTLIAIGASALYLLDVRPGLKDISNGHGSW